MVGFKKKEFDCPRKSIGSESFQITALTHLEEFMHVLKLPEFQYVSKYK